MSSTKPRRLAETFNFRYFLTTLLAIWGPIDDHGAPIVVVETTKRDDFPIDEAIIERKRKYQHLNLWPGDALYVRNHGPEAESPIKAGICNFYAYVTFSNKIHSEISATPPITETLISHFKSFDQAVGSSQTPIALAATATCVFESPYGRISAIQLRSREVVNAGGMWGVVPMFGLENNRGPSSQSSHGLITYNFLKEFLEEMYGYEELIRAASNPRTNMDWIFDLPEGRALINQLQNDKLKLYCTGTGIDLCDGSVTIAVLAHFSDPAYLEHLKLTAAGSLESQASDRQPVIEFINLLDAELHTRADIRSMEPTSIFSLDLARQYLAHQL